MTQIAKLGAPTLTGGRQIKFTPERIQQIKNLVERGKSREEIAELIGVTVGSLQVTCSRLGISLRRPSFNNGIVRLRRNEPRFDRVSATDSGDGSDGALLQLTEERLERNSPCEPAEQVQAPAPRQERGERADEVSVARFAIRIQYRGEERTTELPLLTHDMIAQLAFEAAFRNMSIGEFVYEIILGALREDLFQAVLERREPDEGKAAAP
jgi:uncharacterized protein with GYD domain